ncbi:MAG: hypothetical protein ACIAQ0_02830 [Phycisphaerales bacterium JB058]
MDTDTATVLTAVGVIWSTLWMLWAVVPFFRNPERLFKDFYQAGSIAAALSRIDSEVILKELASLFGAALEAQEDRRRRADIERLLSQVEFAETLERLDAAASDKATIVSCYESLRAHSGRIWKCGVLHLVMLIGGFMLAFFPAQTVWSGMSAVVVFTLSAIAAVISAAFIFKYGREMSLLLELLEHGDA